MMPASPAPVPVSPWAVPAAAPSPYAVPAAPSPWAVPAAPSPYRPAVPYSAFAAPSPYQPTPYRVRSSHHSLASVAVIALAVAIILVIVAGVSQSLGPGGRGGGIVPPTVPTAIRSTRPTTAQPSTPSGQTSTPSGQTTPGSGTFQNDDYGVPDPNLNPPDVPIPDTYTQATDWMQNNVFYGQTVPVPVRCELPDTDPSTASRADLQTLLDDVVACLMRVWAPELQAAGFNASRPSVTIYTGSVQTGCGLQPSGNAFYCMADQQVYYATDVLSVFPNNQHDPFAVVAVLAHEFGHAIQAQTGIMYSEAVWQQRYNDAGDDASAMQMSRRTEMQADCFAGEFFDSVSQSAGVSDDEHQTLSQLFFSLGDDQLTGIPGDSEDHGTGANRQYWFQVGLGSPAVASCNTYTADDSQVH